MISPMYRPGVPPSPGLAFHRYFHRHQLFAKVPPLLRLRMLRKGGQGLYGPEMVGQMHPRSDSGTKPLVGGEEPLVDTLEKSYTVDTTTSNDKLFASLLGLYSVAAVLPAKPGQNPVGGKWTRKSGLAQKLLNTRATYQHLLPTNSTGLAQIQRSNSYRNDMIAEAVNVISLEALFGLIRLNVILRGDAIPLSLEEREVCEDIAKSKAKDKGVDNKVGKLTPLTVRAKFDPPRIVFGRRGRILNLNVGPRSSVVLDTTYCDDSIRVGKGGTSGTKFLFRRIPSRSDADVEKANEWRPLLARRPMRKSKALIILGSMLGCGIRSAVKGQSRVLGLSISTISALLGAVVVFSSGGIEDDDDE